MLSKLSQVCLLPFLVAAGLRRHCQLAMTAYSCSEILCPHTKLFVVIILTRNLYTISLLFCFVRGKIQNSSRLLQSQTCILCKYIILLWMLMLLFFILAFCLFEVIVSAAAALTTWAGHTSIHNCIYANLRELHACVRAWGRKPLTSDQHVQMRRKFRFEFSTIDDFDLKDH